MQPRANFLFDQGSAKVAEDQLIFFPPFCYGVADGVSGLYLPEEGPRLFGGQTGGQAASSAVVEAFASKKSRSPEFSLLAANRSLSALVFSSGMDPEHSELLPAATFAVAAIVGEKIRIIQGADSLAVWLLRDGSVGGISSQMIEYEARLRAIIAGLMQKHHQDRAAMWNEFRPILTQNRREHINQTYAVINGQAKVAGCWQEVNLRCDQVKTLLLFTDGLVPFELICNPEVMAETVMRQYRDGGLHHILACTRKQAEAEKATSHEDLPEATAIALEF